MDSLKRGPLPKYARLAQHLRHAIRSGDLAPGEQLPTEEELCAEYGVSRGTVQQALRQLVRDGLVRRHRGRGTFVAGRAAAPSIFFSLVGFNEQMRRQGRTPGTKLLSAALQPAAARVAEQLDLPDGTPVLYIARLRLADGEPLMYETRYMAEMLCPSLLEHDLERRSIHKLLTKHYGIPLVKMAHAAELRPLFPATAKILHAEPGEHAFIIDRLTHTIEDDRQRPAVLYHAVLRAGVFQLEARAAFAAGTDAREA